jgi:hypothetical protein
MAIVCLINYRCTPQHICRSAGVIQPIFCLQDVL